MHRIGCLSSYFFFFSFHSISFTYAVTAKNYTAQICEKRIRILCSLHLPFPRSLPEPVAHYKMVRSEFNSPLKLQSLNDYCYFDWISLWPSEANYSSFDWTSCRRIRIYIYKCNNSKVEKMYIYDGSERQNKKYTNKCTISPMPIAYTFRAYTRTHAHIDGLVNFGFFYCGEIAAYANTLTSVAAISRCMLFALCVCVHARRLRSENDSHLAYSGSKHAVIHGTGSHAHTDREYTYANMLVYTYARHFLSEPK